MLAAACIVAYAGGFDDDAWAIDHDEAIEIAYSQSPIFDVMLEPMRASYLQPHVLHVTFNRLSTARPILDEYFPNADAGPSQPSAVVRRSPVLERDPSSSPPSARPAKRVRLLSPSPDEDLFHPSVDSRAPSEEPPVTRSQGKRKATPRDKDKDTTKAPTDQGKSKGKGKGKGKAKAPSVPVNRAYVLVPPLRNAVGPPLSSQSKAPRLSEADRSAGIQTHIQKFNFALTGREGLKPIPLSGLLDTAILSDPYLPGAWCTYCIARRLPSCIPEYTYKKTGGSPPIPIRCNNCKRADQRCSFSYGEPINEEWRTMQLSSGARQPHLIRHSYVTLQSLVHEHNNAVADAHFRMESALNLRSVIEAQQNLFRLVGGDPKMLLGMLSHDRTEGPLSEDEAAMVAAVMGWETVPSVKGYHVKKAGGHYFLFDANRKLVASTETANEDSGFIPPTPNTPTPSIRRVPSSPAGDSDHFLLRAPSLSLPSPVTNDQMLIDFESQHVSEGEESVSGDEGEDASMVVDEDADGEYDEDIEDITPLPRPRATHSQRLISPAGSDSIGTLLQAPSGTEPTLQVQSAPPLVPSTSVAAGGSVSAPLPSVEDFTVDPPVLSAKQRKNQRKKQNRKNRRERERQGEGDNA
ncbi:hypothetical protein PQX77_021153 [Marasmius sp. AFHP31]|nr:hypothetical protein PQX77_021153 [Marasmius sp. AFHP31]